MVFSSFLFLFAFLPACLFTYFLMPRRLKNAWLLLCSYFFYGWGAPKMLPLLIALTAVNYGIANRIGAAHSDRRGRLLSLGIVLNLSGLLYFKYANFFVGEINKLLAGLGVEQLAWTAVVLPIGISFFTFHQISYLVDVYRGIVSPAKNLIDFGLYIALFPQLIAGPIIRYHEIGGQIARRTHSIDGVFAGIIRFSFGLAKKVLIADVMGNVADNVFKLQLDQVSTFYAWVGITAYAYQIFFDFSGYSDMAIGLGLIFGFIIPENFNHPYTARNITDFWRRWHISLSRWMRDYLYIPLGGSRGSALKTYRNLWIVFLLSGFWHGASWTFIVWGAYHGMFLTLDRMFWGRISERLPLVIACALNFIIVLCGWVLFRSDTLGHAAEYLGRMFLLSAPNPQAIWPARFEIIHDRGIFIFAVATLLSFGPAFAWTEWRARRQDPAPAARELLRFAAALGCVVLSVFALATSDFNPFIYFRF